jgi:hypothetical protein
MNIFVLRNVGSGKLHYGETVHYVAFDLNGKGLKFEDDIQIGTSIVLDLNSVGSYSWQTTCVKEIFENTPDHKHFRTENTEYMLSKTKITNEAISNGKGHN